jgi:plasmid maintenance system antidote protein VapI
MVPSYEMKLTTMSQIKTKSKIPFEPDYAIAPGRTLLETIEALGIDQNELAERTGLTPKTVNLIIKGKAPLTQQTAMLLERVTSVPARIWNNLESNFREQLARIASHKQLEKQLDWLKQIPTKELISRGAISATFDRVTLLDQTLKFFGVASVESWNEGWSDGQFAFRKSHQIAENDGKLASWLRLAELHGQQMTASRYNKEHFGRVAKSTRGLTIAEPEVFLPKLIESFASAGVALCLVPEIPGAKISGAAKWLSPDKALIAVNLRGKKNDLFWFTLFHEVGHILNDSKKETYIDISYSDDPQEKNANQFARDLLIPPSQSQKLSSLRTRSEVVAFANQIGIAPGIVVGRLQHEKMIAYSYLNDLKDTFNWK